MRILAIETSCDETGIAILETTGALGAISPRAQIKVLADVLVSQASIHAEFGGVFPALARREHAKNMMPLIIRALSEADLLRPQQSVRILHTKEKETLEKIFYKEPELFEAFKTALLDISIPDIDAIAVTSGPGLEPALWVGINTAEALGTLWGVPVIPVNHMEGHIVASLLTHKSTTDGKKNFALASLHYPALTLLISGGHTELVLMARAGTYEVLGQTRDDAVGEAFDKVARMLGLAYPGGPEISKLAEQVPTGKKLIDPLPRPMLSSKNFDFSFSGLKTSVLYAIKKIPSITPEMKAIIAKDFEDSVTEVLVAKTLAAAKKYNVYEIILGGGVSANKKIRAAFINAVRRELPGVTLFLPDQKLSTDNGLMIGVAGLLRSSKVAKKIIAEGHLCLSQNSRPTLAELRKRK
ncbi:MAG: O-sialoglycoprotein endopeptidase [Parcubacteria group bacterium GW2011_GWC1_42_11]|uniref:tRNA N6-adenosine threonylcarbamoyltransferase n=1 Tax=Candidatus Nomurabacteria bacterium GW2011_GWC2_42_20 TaxID=1618756 RepID=A0A0G0ZG59_9BACT|nr:MAG: O-sialoglycoprotein endopeptidase [Parcubacteria group bacterium GW2011_GWC1_42_11]KKS47730.1 MAG: O-sialoglycoprotein endopeptidase [Candidatus Nomurabacteria bacterium GW2011_GWC2_42_20]KKT08633.1 MAG: O-sialoglycoprotein endopeptidase [Candidatus Nomurabacteria bacterium GW2011_GWB1_43_20]TAN36373.1 MAG: tRNA (adenosine(37)-N6)-threonylcarbamoyltransferase complex transferase subunit TsaD [Patescibacteria group bacterium]HBH71624.1 tRNA (adenosine(37)-N6)-threonylcarbamoyltransferase